MNVLIVYCHPSSKSFTSKLKNAFIEGLKKGGHEYEISDLYEMGFEPAMSENEYLFDSIGQRDDGVRISGDVSKEQIKIQTSDAVAFIFPMFWSASPAKLVGWFQRVMTKDFAYGENATMDTLEKACCLVTMADDIDTAQGSAHISALKATMINSKIFTNAKQSEINVFDKLGSDKLTDSEREALMEEYLKKAYELGANL